MAEACRTVLERSHWRIMIYALSTSINASCGMFTEPNDFIRFFPSFCFSRSFAFARNIAPVTLRRHILAQRPHRFARNDFAADRGLNGHGRIAGEG